jgi:hypothetical protein
MIRFSSNDGALFRQDRLVDAYRLLSQEVREVVSGMHDHKGIMTVTVRRFVPSLTWEVRNAWEAQHEYNFEIFHNGVLKWEEGVTKYGELE